MDNGEFTDNYNRVVAKYYDAAYEQMLSREGIDYYAALASRRGGPVLELGCGTGRVLLELSRRGISCVGLDSSQAMLDQLSSKPEAAGLELVRAQMQDFDLSPRKFCLVYSAFRPFQHLYTVDEQLACLERVLAHLEPGGLFSFDVFNPRLDRIWRPSEPERVDLRFEHDGVEVTRTVSERRDLVRQLTEVTMRFDELDGGRVVQSETELIRMRWFTRYELEHLMARAGFKNVVTYGDFDRSSVGPGSPQLVVEASAPA